MSNRITKYIRNIHILNTFNVSFLFLYKAVAVVVRSAGHAGSLWSAHAPCAFCLNKLLWSCSPVHASFTHHDFLESSRALSRARARARSRWPSGAQKARHYTRRHRRERRRNVAVEVTRSSSWRQSTRSTFPLLRTRSSPRCSGSVAGRGWGVNSTTGPRHRDADWVTRTPGMCALLESSDAGATRACAWWRQWRAWAGQNRKSAARCWLYTLFCFNNTKS